MATLKLWDGSAWQLVSGQGEKGVNTWVGPEAPTGTIITGDLWYDTDDTSGTAFQAMGQSTSTTGAPTTGTWNRGDEWLDSTNTAWRCVNSGSPGGWLAQDLAWTSYTPVWTTTGSAPGLGNGSIVGRYMRVGKLCAVSLRMVMGSTSGGGNGACLFSLPFSASTNTPAWLALSGYIYMAANGTHWAGTAQLQGNGNQVGLLLPSAANNATAALLRNADGTNQAGTGSPTVAGAYPLSNGSAVNINGTYEIQ